MTVRSQIKRNTYAHKNPYDSKFPGLNIDPKLFNAMLREYGIRIRHEKSTPCPNLKGNIDSGHHRLNCTLCDNGFVNYDPYEYTAYFQSNTLERVIQAQGFFDPGTALLTVPTLLEDKNTYIYIHYFDRITLIDFEDRYTELVQKTKGEIDLLRYQALNVEYLATKNVRYEQGQDFEIDDNGNILWISSNRPGRNEVPEYGEIYSIAYVYRPVYRIVHLLHEGRFSQRKLKLPAVTPERFPQQCVIKKDFLLDRRDDVTDEKIEAPVLP